MSKIYETILDGYPSSMGFTELTQSQYFNMPCMTSYWCHAIQYHWDSYHNYTCILCNMYMYMYIHWYNLYLMSLQHLDFVENLESKHFPGALHLHYLHHHHNHISNTTTCTTFNINQCTCTMYINYNVDVNVLHACIHVGGYQRSFTVDCTCTCVGTCVGTHVHVQYMHL